jgi:probable F420-dependent oxidoreductase
MDFGIHIGTRGCLTTRDTIMALAQQAEAHGYAYLGVADHLIVPAQTAERYPYTADGVWPGAPTGECFDAIATLAFIAGCTTRIKLLTSVIVVPHRPAVLTAKLLLTADVLSGGRVVAGVGSGWMREEFSALGTPPFAERGAVTDEYLQAWKLLWTQDRPALAGKYANFHDVVFMPKPVSQPHPPIWVGGESGPSLRRAARLGDAWYPIGSNNRHLLDTLPRYRAGIARLRRFAQEAGRDPATVALTYRVKRYGEAVPATASDGERRLFSGGTADLVDDFRALRDLGVSAVDIDFERPDAAASIAEMRRFKETVLARV